MHNKLSLGIMLTFSTLFLPANLHAEEAAPLQRLPLTADDIAATTELNIYKFRVAIEPKSTFEIAVYVQQTPQAEPEYLARQSFTSDTESDTVDLLLSFMPRDDTQRGVLLSQDEAVDYRVSCPDCSPSGIATIIPLPLKELPGTHKTYFPLTTKTSQKLSTKDETCLIAIVASRPGKAASLTEGFPRGIVSVKLTDR